MVPLFALLVALGGTGTVLIYRLGNRIDEILRENYDSVIYMRDLNEALERIDSSFQFALAGREQESYKQYAGTTGRGTMPALSQGAAQHHLARRSGTGGQADETERPLSPSRGRVFQAPAARDGTSSILASRTSRGSMGTFREIKAVSGEISADQPGQHGRGKPAGAPHGPFLPDLVWRRLGDRHCLGRVPRRQHDSHDPVPDSRRHRIGRGHRRRQPGSTRARLLRG